VPADHGTPNTGDERWREVDDFDEQAITDILVGIDEVLESHGRQRMDIIDGPTVDALRDVVKRELVAARDRARSPQGEDHEATRLEALGAYLAQYSPSGFTDRYSASGWGHIARGVLSAAAVFRPGPARDGTVAVEDVWWWLAKNRRSPALAAEFRAEFGVSERTERIHDQATKEKGR
jgi:hypothetical protein